MTIRPIGMGRRIGVLFLSIFVVGSSAVAQSKEKNKELPRTILIIRHAEKPLEDPESVHLNAEGKKRAAELSGLFKASKSRPDPFPTPDFVFAARDSKHSHRCTETVALLAKDLKLSVNSTFDEDDFAKAAHEILDNPKYGGKTILIAWRHGMIPDLAKALKADAPESWKGTVFDRVWQITYDKNGAATFRDLPQQLLANDSNK